ncbi:addiction module toxin, RelE/StbE family [Nitrosococcus halophilus Nc 4]|uniref:Addiction module toxin, RelE/StbE family n=1 Tax=Nitrosococcus halophilus (strain Nc4) TaxID=472759 RepID=D5BUW4_NITHN|nr:type II toxin-antitoxin system mRNA interferase toxin, RelE/StbE family [Nitrosococcus halophilus]ADE13514.1 addiction module toxin, RelE/StbE family [Nitrosococcus halophilus Nc 4]
MRVKWTRPASTDLKHLQYHIAQDNPHAAFRVASLIREQTGRLSEHPYSGRPGRVEGTRELVVSGTPYVVAYRIREGNVDILAVIHGARKWPEAFE